MGINFKPVSEVGGEGYIMVESEESVIRICGVCALCARLGLFNYSGRTGACISKTVNAFTF